MICYMYILENDNHSKGQLTSAISTDLPLLLFVSVVGTFKFYSLGKFQV